MLFLGQLLNNINVVHCLPDDGQGQLLDSIHVKLWCAADHGVFNVALQALLDKDRKKYPHLKVPLIFQEVRV